MANYMSTCLNWTLYPLWKLRCRSITARAPEPQSRPPSAAAAAAAVVVGDRSDARDNVINVNNKDEGAPRARAWLCLIHRKGVEEGAVGARTPI